MTAQNFHAASQDGTDPRHATITVVLASDFDALQQRERKLREALEKADKWIYESFEFEMPLNKHVSDCVLQAEIQAALAHGETK